MKHIVALWIVGLFIIACATPIPRSQSIVPSPVPSILTTPIPGAPSIVSSPMPSTRAYATPTLVPSSTPQQPVPTDQLLPALDRTINLGSNQPKYSTRHSIALDDQHKRLYISLSISQTLVFDAETLTKIGEVPFGGMVSVYPEVNRLYIGVPGQPAELKMFDASTLALRSSTTFSDTSGTAPYALPDPTTGKLYVVHDGVYIADADTLTLVGILSATRPITPGYGPTAFDAAIAPTQHRLFVSLDPHVSSANNYDFMRVYDLESGQELGGDSSPRDGFASISLDPQSGFAYVPRSYLGGSLIRKIDPQGTVVRTFYNSPGDARVIVDAAHQRVYLISLEWLSRVFVRDLDLNYLGEAPLPAIQAGADFYMDASRDRLLALSQDALLYVLRGHAQPMAWPQQPAPRRGPTEWIAPSPSVANDHIVYAAFSASSEFVGYGSLYRSRDDGASWEFIGRAPMNNSVSSLTYASNSTLFASTSWGGSVGVWRSDDGGQTWYPSSRGLTGAAINQVVASPDFSHDHTLFAASARSDDGGATWQSLGFGWETLAISPNFAHDNSLISSQGAALEGGVYVSHDRGESWQQVSAEPVSHLAYGTGRMTHIIYAANNDGVMCSDDSGDHWTGVSAGLDLENAVIRGLAVSDRFAYLLVTTYHQPTRVYQLAHGESVWSPIPSVPPTATALAANDDVLFIGTSDGQVVRYTPTALTVAPATQPQWDGRNIRAIAIAPAESGNEVFVADGSSGVWATRDLVHWRDTNFPDRLAALAMQVVLSPDYAHDTTLFAAAGLGAYRSRDGGYTWEMMPIQSNTGVPPIGSIAVSPNFAADRTVLAATSDYWVPAVWRSTDGGDTWASLDMSSVFTDPTAELKLRVMPTSDRSYWIWIDPYGLFHSDDAGQTWTHIVTDTTSTTTWVVSPDFADNGVMWIGLSGAILTTEDAGRTWDIFIGTWDTGATPLAIAFSPSFVHDRTVFVGLSTGLYRTDDGGATWHKSDAGLPLDDRGFTQVWAVAVSPNFATDNTVLIKTQDGLAISRDHGNTWVPVGQ